MIHGGMALAQKLCDYEQEALTKKTEEEMQWSAGVASDPIWHYMCGAWLVKGNLREYSS